MTKVVASIDIGTNSVLLLVARGERGRLERLVDRAQITRLGKGVDQTRALDPAAIERTLAVLRDYVTTARNAGANSIRAVGTSATRDATNKDDFLGPAREILGADVEVITGLREAELTFCGGWENLNPPSAPATVFDIGGGSTEFVVGVNGRVEHAHSLDIGSVRLFERFVRSDPPTAGEMTQVRAIVRAELKTLSFALPRPLLGIAGTMTTLAAVLHRIAPYDGQRVHGMRITHREVDELLEKFLSMPLAERSKLPGLEPARADVIVPGCALVSEILAFTGIEDVIVSDGGVRVGLAMQMLENT